MSAASPLSKEESRTHVYGMPYEEWKERHQREATPSQLRGLREASRGIKAASTKST